MSAPVENAIAKYLTDRSALIADERSLRRDFAKISNASKDELKADEIIRCIRRTEAETIWSIEHEDTPNVFPGMEFLSGRELIMKTKIFRILNKMPKGALLHAHLDAMVNAKFLLHLALKHPAMHVRVPEALTVQNIKSILPTFSGLPQSLYTQNESLATETYLPESWVNISTARSNFPEQLGGPEGFDDWVLSALTINPREAYGTHNTVLKIWEKFQSTFAVAEGLTRFQPIWGDYIREFFRTSVEDGISYIEARINFLQKTMIGSDGEPNIPHRDWLKIFDEVLKEFKADLSAQGRGDEFYGARIIYSTIRFITCEELEWYLEDCIALKKEFPHLIAGFDLVGNENTLKPLIYYIEPLLKFKRRVEEEGLDIPFIFHAGETLGDGSDADNNLFDAILLGTKRIGHGFSLPKHPLLMDLCKANDITVEVCPISNEILRLTSSMPAHPLAMLVNNGVSVALCSDDPAVFGNMGLSFDYFQVLVSSDITGLISLGEIALKSIEASTLGAEEKTIAVGSWEKRWARFVQSVVSGEWETW